MVPERGGVQAAVPHFHLVLKPHAATQPRRDEIPVLILSGAGSQHTDSHREAVELVGEALFCDLQGLEVLVPDLPSRLLPGAQPLKRIWRLGAPPLVPLVLDKGCEALLPGQPRGDVRSPCPRSSLPLVAEAHRVVVGEGRASCLAGRAPTRLLQPPRLLDLGGWVHPCDHEGADRRHRQIGVGEGVVDAVDPR